MTKHIIKGAGALLFVLAVAACPIAPHAIVGSWATQIENADWGYTLVAGENGAYTWRYYSGTYEDIQEGTYQVTGSLDGELLLYDSGGYQAQLWEYRIEGSKLTLISGGSYGIVMYRGGADN